MQDLFSHPYLVCLTVETTSAADHAGKLWNNRRLFGDNQLAEHTNGTLQESATTERFDAVLPQLIELNWCIFNIRQTQVEADGQVFVTPTLQAPLSEATTETTGVTANVLGKLGVDFQIAIRRLDQTIEETCKTTGCDATSFQVVTFGDWPVRFQIKQQAAALGFEFAPHSILRHEPFNVLRLVYGQKEALQNPVASLEDLLKIFDLKPLPSKLTRAKSDCQSILRVLNRVAKQFKVKCEIDPNSKMPSFSSPPVVSPIMMDEPKEAEVGLKSKDKDKVVEQRPVRNRSRSRDQERTKDTGYKPSESPISTGPPSLTMTNIPKDASEIEVAQFFGNIKIKNIDLHRVAAEEDPFDEKYNWCFVELENAEDLSMAILLSGQPILDRPVFVTARAFSMESPSQGAPHEAESYPALKLRGLPWSVQQQDIVLFFSGYKLLADSIKMGQSDDGKATGQVACLFETQDEAKLAMQERQGQNVGHRWIEIYQITYADYLNFNEEQMKQKFVRANALVTDSNRDRTVKLRGLPFSASVADIVEFFRGFNVTTSDVVIEQARGKPTGYAIVFLDSLESATRAKAELNRKNIGTRYVEVLDPPNKF